MSSRKNSFGLNWVLTSITLHSKLLIYQPVFNINWHNVGTKGKIRHCYLVYLAFKYANQSFFFFFEKSLNSWEIKHISAYVQYRLTSWYQMKHGVPFKYSFMQISSFAYSPFIFFLRSVGKQANLTLYTFLFSIIILVTQHIIFLKWWCWLVR